MRIQLRRYRTAPGEAPRFASEWKSGVVPLRERHGFTIVGGWVVEDEVGDDDEFVWVIGYEGPESFEAAEAGYFASAERSTLDPDPARLVVSATVEWVRPAL